MTLMRVRDGNAVDARSCWDVTSFRQQAGRHAQDACGDSRLRLGMAD
jgi:hypothetical protein